MSDAEPYRPLAQQEWAVPGVEEVAEGIHRIPLPLPFDALKAVNVYAIADGDGLILIDSGWALEEAQRQLEESLAKIGHDLGDVRQFLVTHVHRDHYTLGVVLRRLFGSRVALGEHERDSLVGIREGAEERAPVTEILRLRSYGASELAETLLTDFQWDGVDRTMWEDPDEWLSGGTKITLEARTLEVIHTPGHTTGHVVFRDAEAGLMFTGDHILPHITPSIGFERARPELPLGDYLASLRLVADLPDVRMLPAHGPVSDSVHARTAELFAHHDQRLVETQATVEKGAGTAFESARMLPWTRRARAFGELDAFNQMLAVSETSAHLDVLVQQGRLRGSVEDGVTRYTCG